jgi:hypothetical protein
MKRDKRGLEFITLWKTQVMERTQWKAVRFSVLLYTGWE